MKRKAESLSSVYMGGKGGRVLLPTAWQIETLHLISAQILIITLVTWPSMGYLMILASSEHSLESIDSKSRKGSTRTSQSRNFYGDFGETLVDW